MIRAELEKDAHSFTLHISGHAGLAPKGEDLVCAAVSALVYGLDGYVTALEKEGFVLPDTRVQMSSGRAEICLCPESQAREQSGGAFALAAEMLAVLGKHFPENIHFTEKRRTINDN